MRDPIVTDLLAVEPATDWEARTAGAPAVWSRYTELVAIS
jgi:hypothetical protein